MKVQEKTPEKELNETRASNSLNIVFKEMVIRLLNNKKEDIKTIMAEE